MELILLILGVGALAGLFTSDDSSSGEGGSSEPAQDTLSGELVEVTDSRGDGVVTLDGHDVVIGGPGSDSIETNAGDDLAFGGAGADYINTGSGNDTVAGGSGHDDIQLGAGDDFYAPFAYFTGVPSEYDEPAISNNWTGGYDLVYGGSGDDVIWDDRGRDTLHGDAGNDVLFAVEGPNSDNSDDQLFGGSGDDVLVGDRGDALTGGAGSDTYYVTVASNGVANVVVKDFDMVDDRVVLDLSNVAVASNDAITLTEVRGDTHVFFAGLQVATLEGVVDVDLDLLSFRTS